MLTPSMERTQPTQLLRTLTTKTNPKHHIRLMATISSHDEASATHDSHSNSIEMHTPSDQLLHDGSSQKPMASALLSHSLSPDDPNNPMNWPLYRKIYVSLCGYLFAASVLVPPTTRP